MRPALRLLANQLVSMYKNDENGTMEEEKGAKRHLLLVSSASSERKAQSHGQGMGFGQYLACCSARRVWQSEERESRRGQMSKLVRREREARGDTRKS